jgi:hypothetical protein
MNHSPIPNPATDTRILAHALQTIILARDANSFVSLDQAIQDARRSLSGLIAATLYGLSPELPPIVPHPGYKRVPGAWRKVA